MPGSFDGFCSLWSGVDNERGRMRDSVRILPKDNFKNVFDVGLYIFSIISNLFDSNKPYALSTHNRTCANKCIIFGKTLKIRVKKKLTKFV